MNQKLMQLGKYLGNATSSVASALGFSIENAVSWMQVNLLLPIMGTGLGVLYDLRWYILGLVAVSIAIYFAFRAFGFFRN